MMLQGCRKADRAEVVERDCFATPNSLKSQGERNYFPRLVILVPKRQSCACLRGQYTLRKITRHSNQVPRLNLRSARGTAGAPLPEISCLGAFWTPAATARGRVRYAGVQKPAQFPPPARPPGHSPEEGGSRASALRRPLLATLMLVAPGDRAGRVPGRLDVPDLLADLARGRA